MSCKIGFKYDPMRTNKKKTYKITGKISKQRKLKN